MTVVKYPISKDWMEEQDFNERPVGGYGVGAVHNGIIIDIAFRHDLLKQKKARKDPDAPLTEEEVLKLTWKNWMKDKPEGTRYFIGYAIGYRFIL